MCILYLEIKSRNFNGLSGKILPRHFTTLGDVYITNSPLRDVCLRCEAFQHFQIYDGLSLVAW